MSIDIDPMVQELARLNAEVLDLKLQLGSWKVRVEALRGQRDLAFKNRDEALNEASKWEQRARAAKDCHARTQQTAERTVRALADIVARAAAGLGGSTGQ
jgi:hypothetical protein